MLLVICQLSLRSAHDLITLSEHDPPAAGERYETVSVSSAFSCSQDKSVVNKDIHRDRLIYVLLGSDSTALVERWRAIPAPCSL